MCVDCEYEELLSRIDDLLDSGDCTWAADTLSGIKDWVTEHQHCTEKQVMAVQNIEEGLGYD